MAIKHQVISVGTTNVTVHAGNKRNTSHDVTVTVQVPTGGATVYLGDSGVTPTSYGFAVAPGQNFTMKMNQSETLYAVVASSAQNIYVLKQNVV